MAGYTTRFLLTLSIPFFGFVFWFLKKKNSPKTLSKAIQVEDSASLELFENQFLKLNVMKLKSHEDNPEERVGEENVNSTMQLKETQTSQSQNANGASKGKNKGKSKLREKSHTCPADITNGNDRLHVQDSDENELPNGVEAIDLNQNGSPDGELILNVLNKVTQRDSQTESILMKTKNSQMNGDTKDDSNSQTDNKSTHQNGFTKECDTDACVSHRNSSSNDKICEPSKQTDSHETLMLPIDCTETQGEMLESPGATYCDSVDSTDSGRGASEVQFESYSANQEYIVVNYTFEIPQDLVGRLIGKGGKTIQSIKRNTNTEIAIKPHPSCHDNKLKICEVTGSESEINAALQLIRKKFPPERFPAVTLSQICSMPFTTSPLNLMLRLPEGSSCDVILSAVVDAGHFFLHQPTHPTYHSLIQLTFDMSELYNKDVNVPSLLHMEKGYICAANVGEIWYRAEIEEVFKDSDECRVKFLDYGGYCISPRSSLRQINYKFLHTPFQATECYLAALPPEGESEWSIQATRCFESLAHGQILQGIVVAYAENGIPFVQLIKMTGANMLDINVELIHSHHARPLVNLPSTV